MERQNLRATSTYADTIYAELKKSIVNAELKPNQRITQRDIAKMFNVSLTPVREAIQRLATEKLVTITARSDIKVIAFDHTDFGHLMQLAAMLDSAALRNVINDIPEEGLDQVRRVHTEMVRWFQAGDVENYLVHADRFHESIWALYPNPYVTQVLYETVHKLKIIIANYHAYYTPRILKRSLDQHTEILEAIELRDARRAARVLEKHWSPEFFK